MKFRITMKDPDGVWDSIQSAAIDSVESDDSLDRDERNLLIDHRRERLSEFIRKWVQFGEYMTVEFDTDANTATVVPGE